MAEVIEGLVVVDEGCEPDLDEGMLCCEFAYTWF